MPKSPESTAMGGGCLGWTGSGGEKGDGGDRLDEELNARGVLGGAPNRSPDEFRGDGRGELGNSKGLKGRGGGDSNAGASGYGGIDGGSNGGSCGPVGETGGWKGGGEGIPAAQLSSSPAELHS